MDVCDTVGWCTEFCQARVTVRQNVWVVDVPPGLNLAGVSVRRRRLKPIWGRWAEGKIGSHRQCDLCAGLLLRYVKKGVTLTRGTIDFSTAATPARRELPPAVMKIASSSLSPGNQKTAVANEQDPFTNNMTSKGLEG